MLDGRIREQLDRLEQLMTEQTFVVLTGAGISTPSGIPDYRDNQGVRRGRQPMMYQEFLSAPRMSTPCTTRPAVTMSSNSTAACIECYASIAGNAASATRFSN